MVQGIRIGHLWFVFVLVAATAFVAPNRVEAQTPPCPGLDGALATESVPTFAPTAAPDARGFAWLDRHPMPISALVATVPDPPPHVVDRYLDGLGANAVHLWMDGPEQVEAWLRHRRGTSFITWLSPDGTSLAWDGSEFVDTGRLIGGLGRSIPGRIGFQLGDEPASSDDMNRIAAGIGAVRTADPEALLYTNMTYWIPDVAGLVQQYVSSVDADIVLTGDYNFGPAHYTVLQTFRSAGLAKNVPYWQYLNAYIGQETECQFTHTRSDMLWQAMAGLTYGYTGHHWFLYQSAAVGHESATNWGGSTLLQPVGGWGASPTGHHGIVAEINNRLANLGKAVTELTSVDVRFDTANHHLSIQPVDTQPWSLGAGGDPYLVGVDAAPGQAPLEILTGFFVDDVGERYLMVQNARHTHSTQRPNPQSLPGSASIGTIHLTFDFAGAPRQVGRSHVRVIRSIDGVRDDLPLTDLGGSRRRATVVLDAGDALLIKYATPNDFRFGPAREDVGLVDPVTGIWRLRRGAAITAFYYGVPGDEPFMGDWDCDGIDTPGLYRRSTGFVYLRNSISQGIADVSYFFGNPGDIPIAGDFDGDGCDTVSIYRPSEGRVYVINRLGSGGSGAGAADVAYHFGNPGDKPFVGDFDNDGVDTVGLHRETTGLVYFRNSHTAGNAQQQFHYGVAGDRIIAGDWTGAGFSTPGLFRPGEARFFLRYANTEGVADDAFPMGTSRQIPVAGTFG